MKRKIFFWLEQLKITPAERKTVSILLVLFLGLALVNNMLTSVPAFEQAHYTALEKAFHKHSALVKQKEEKLLANYHPVQKAPEAAPPDTLPADTTASAKKENDSSTRGDEKINVNTADAKTLESLPGVGPVYARRIIEYRRKNGPFRIYEELLKIKGIGKKRLEKLLPFVQLKKQTENK